MSTYRTMIVAVLAGLVVWAGDAPAPARQLSSGNFLFAWNPEKWTSDPHIDSPVLSSMILLSPALSDPEKQAMIDDYVAHGNNRIHLYFTNDDNYSGRRYGTGGLWKGVRWHPVFLRNPVVDLPANFDRMPEAWYARTAEQQLDDWRRWLVQMRQKGLRITAWMQPNDARDTFNSDAQWPDDKWLAYQNYLLEKVCNYRWNGEECLVDELVVKLEADDEWSTRNRKYPHLRDNIDKLNRRVRLLRKAMTELGCTQTLWYHNEADNSDVYGKVWDHFAWDAVDGIRIQVGLQGRTSPGEVAMAADIHVAQIPEDKLFYWSEYAGGDGYVNSWIGDALYEHYKDNPRFMGLDNGGGPKRQP